MSLRFPHLDRSPVVEALIDFSAQFPEAVLPERLAVDPSAVLGDGASSSPIRNIQAEILFSAEDEPGVTTGSGLVGYRFESAGGDRVAQFRQDGMTFSIVGTYTHWDDLQTEAAHAFAIYQQACGGQVPILAAVRFINRIEIPFGIPLDRFLQVAPPVPAGVSIGITAFQSRTDMRDEDSGLAIALGLLAAETPDESGVDSASVLLDISVRSEMAFALPLVDPFTSDFAIELGRIRDAKNAVFFGSLTSQALARYQNSPS